MDAETETLPFPIGRPLHVRAIPDTQELPEAHRDLVARLLPGRS